jgi:hypothetical protein
MRILHRIFERFAFSSALVFEYHVNHPCTVTAASRSQLKSLPLSKLRKYKDAYSIQVVENVVEKDHLIDILMAARVRFVPMT